MGLKLVAGSRTAVGTVLVAWALEVLQMLVMDQALLCKVFLWMARKATVVDRSLLDQHPFLN